ncbi:putative MFS family arabinose efflux permease [Sphingomonas sp. PP-F2F-A104-K0414]|uniref:MFS transporter n=1 Tax=Sphingomonas sp. PP-F2F-A104-K0414 TaxID=2135661 RepID=UPI001049282B|nr:MFS transporter [Sphingomonas sp. PP-F2F-A104-K0414]TCQ00752.1 putative MFS family arabinose efflux permease [Sphingomonas sp. PP-F2F-A104-K0414]
MTDTDSKTPETSSGMTTALTTVFAVACGMMVANLYYAQALIGEIAPALGLHGSTAGLIVTLTQLGYGAGLLLIVSLADLVENRRLILMMVAGTTVGLIGVVFSNGAMSFLLFSFVTGFCSVGAQIMVPLAAHLAPDAKRGQVIGNIMAGLITGIMLARPLASGLASVAGWRAIFAVSAVAMVALALLLAKMLPERRPSPGLGYGQILASSFRLLARTPAIRRRTAYQATMFAIFNLFWTAVPLVLARKFGLGQVGIALFALAGAGGALTAPIAGRLGDRGYIRIGTGIALGSAILACMVAGWAGAVHMLIVLALAAVLLDAATQLNQVLGQRVIYSIAPEARGRINAIYMTVVFLGGAAGSMLASFSLYHGGWTATMAVGGGLAVAAFALFLTEPRGDHILSGSA